MIVPIPFSISDFLKFYIKVSGDLSTTEEEVREVFNHDGTPVYYQYDINAEYEKPVLGKFSSIGNLIRTDNDMAFSAWSESPWMQYSTSVLIHVPSSHI